ncbi:MAG: TonB-dependent receptor domain-containing protein [Pyrinomonadaceae bacterium]
MTFKKLSKLTLFPLIFFFAIQSFDAQEASSLQIILTDSESALITRALIKLKTRGGKTIKEINGEQSENFVLSPVKEGVYVLEIQSNGFEPLVKNIEIKRGENVLNITLEVSAIKANVEVTREQAEKRFEEAFSRNLSVEEIEALPSNPDEIEAELKRKYGDDILIRVNGFTGGRLPPKEMIASIKVIRSSFDAEFHQIGQTIVDIKTKAGLPKIFGFFAFNFNDARMNARNAFAPERLPAQNKFLIAFLGGPLIKKKTSFTASVFAIDSYQKNNIVAVVPGRTIENKIKSGSRIFSPSIGIDHNLSKNHTLHLTYSIEKFDLTNAGVGEFNLPETGFSSRSTNHRVRLSESGTIGKTYANEFRLELLNSVTAAIPNTRAVSVTVLNAFTAGGASVDNRSRQRQLDAVDNLLFDRGKHSIKIGGEIQLDSRKSFSADNTNGTFTFTSLTNYLNNHPAIFTQRQGTSEIRLNQAQIAVYAQDDIRLYRNFQIGLGLRYERQNNLRDANNFSPRASFIYSPNREGKIVFRSGAGVFYNWLDAQNLVTILESDGRQASDLIVPYWSNSP